MLNKLLLLFLQFTNNFQKISYKCMLYFNIKILIVWKPETIQIIYFLDIFCPNDTTDCSTLYAFTILKIFETRPIRATLSCFAAPKSYIFIQA